MSDESRHPSRLPWVRMLAEGVAIVLSILLAFGIDAAWDARQVGAREMEYLRALRTEMSLAAEELAEDRGRRDRWVELSDSVLAQISERTVPDSVVNVWVQEAAMGMARFFPPSAVLDDLVSSGGLAALSSNELRFALLSYRRGRERVNFLEDWARAVDEDGLRPNLTEHFRWTTRAPLPLRPDGRLPVDPFEPVDVSPASLRRMLDDPVFENLFRVKRQRLGVVQRRTVELAELIGDVNRLIERETARRGAARPRVQGGASP